MKAIKPTVERGISQTIARWVTQGSARYTARCVAFCAVLSVFLVACAAVTEAKAAYLGGTHAKIETVIATRGERGGAATAGNGVDPGAEPIREGATVRFAKADMLTAIATLRELPAVPFSGIMRLRDATGDVIYAVGYPIDATGGTRELRFEYQIDVARDRPGVWRLELALDGIVVSTRDIVVELE